MIYGLLWPMKIYPPRYNLNFQQDGIPRDLSLNELGFPLETIMYGWEAAKKAFHRQLRIWFAINQSCSHGDSISLIVRRLDKFFTKIPMNIEIPKTRGFIGMVSVDVTLQLNLWHISWFQTHISNWIDLWTHRFHRVNEACNMRACGLADCSWSYPPDMINPGPKPNYPSEIWVCKRSTQYTLQNTSTPEPLS